MYNFDFDGGLLYDKLTELSVLKEQRVIIETKIRQIKKDIKRLKALRRYSSYECRQRYFEEEDISLYERDLENLYEIFQVYDEYGQYLRIKRE